MTVLPFPSAEPRPRFVPRSQRPRRIDVRISAVDGRAPVGRTKIFRLDRHDFEQLVDVAVRLEARA
jgi:hypothetical protein